MAKAAEPDNSQQLREELARVQVAMEADTASARKAKVTDTDKKLAGKPKGPMPNPFDIPDSAPVKKIGRPSSYQPEIGRKVLELLASGKPLTPTMTKEHGLPDPTTIYRWTEDNEAFRLEYTRARQYQAHVYADQLIELSDTAEDANLARLQIDTRKWYASKVLPRVYGDKQVVDVNVDMGKTAAAVLMDLSNRAAQHNVIDVTPMGDASLDKGVTLIDNASVSHVLPEDSGE